MATIRLTYPHNPGVYQTDASGALVPFTARGYVDVPGAPVSLYEDTSGALLGSTAAATVPDAVGDYAGWYAWSIPVNSWVGAPGLPVFAFSGTGAVAVPGVKGALGFTSIVGEGSMSGITYDQVIQGAVPAMLGLGAISGVGITAVVGLPASEGTGAFADTSHSHDTTAPAVGTLTVTPGTGTACTFSVTATDAVGVVKWLLVEGASDPGAADPGQTGATSVASTTSLSLASQAFTSSASSTGVRYWRWHCWDAAGNHGVSAVASATVTIGGEKITRADDFNRADGGLGSNWTTIPGRGSPSVSSNRWLGGAGAGAYYSAVGFSGDHYSQAVIVMGNPVSIVVRQQAAANTRYEARLYYDDVNDDGSLFANILKIVDGVSTQIAYRAATGVAFGNTLRFEAQGTALRLKVNGAETWTGGDSTIAGGAPGLASDTTAAQMDDWAGGDL